MIEKFAQFMHSGASSGSLQTIMDLTCAIVVAIGCAIAIIATITAPALLYWFLMNRVIKTKLYKYDEAARDYDHFWFTYRKKALLYYDTKNKKKKEVIHKEIENLLKEKHIEIPIDDQFRSDLLPIIDRGYIEYADVDHLGDYKELASVSHKQYMYMEIQDALTRAAVFITCMIMHMVIVNLVVDILF